jgi:hypothetical protein
VHVDAARRGAWGHLVRHLLQSTTQQSSKAECTAHINVCKRRCYGCAADAARRGAWGHLIWHLLHNTSQQTSNRCKPR